MRNLLFPLLAILLLAPLAAAQDSTKDENSTRPDDAAWVEDCPPDMMCAAQAEEEPTYSGDCGGEVCAYGNESCIECSGPVDEGQAEPGQALGPEDCIDCMRPPQDDTASNCMDGQQENETCRDDVYYMDGPTRGPEDGSCENCRGEETADPTTEGPIDSHTETQSDAKSDVPAPGLGIVLAGFAVAIALVARKL